MIIVPCCLWACDKANIMVGACGRGLHTPQQSEGKNTEAEREAETEAEEEEEEKDKEQEGRRAGRGQVPIIRPTTWAQ